MNSLTRRTGAVVAAAGLALALASCSGGQSVADACKIADSTVSEANTEMQGIVSDALAGEGDISTLFEPINKALADAQSKVSNAEVSDALKTVSEEFTALGTELGDYQIPDVSDIDMSASDAMEQLEEAQAQAEELSAALQERSQSLMDAGQKLQEVCNAG